MVSVKEGLDIATAGSRCFLKSDEKSSAQFIIFLASSLIGEPQSTARQRRSSQRRDRLSVRRLGRLFFITVLDSN